MPRVPPQSPWRIPLVRELGIVLLIKLALLLTIKVVWFSAPTLPENGGARIDEHLLGTPRPSLASPATLNEEESR